MDSNPRPPLPAPPPEQKHAAIADYLHDAGKMVLRSLSWEDIKTIHRPTLAQIFPELDTVPVYDERDLYGRALSHASMGQDFNRPVPRVFIVRGDMGDILVDRGTANFARFAVRLIDKGGGE